MQAPETVYMVIRVYKNGTEDTDGMEFTSADEASGYLIHLSKILDMEKYERLYVDKVTWLHEI